MIKAVLAVLVTLGFFGVMGAMVLGYVRAGDNNSMLVLLGALGSSWGAIINYYFGSSDGSARKSELLAQAPRSE